MSGGMPATISVTRSADAAATLVHLAEEVPEAPAQRRWAAPRRRRPRWRRASSDTGRSRHQAASSAAPRADRPRPYGRQQAIGDPERQAVDERRGRGAARRAARADEVERLLDGRPGGGPLGAVPRDAGAPCRRRAPRRWPRRRRDRWTHAGRSRAYRLLPLRAPPRMRWESTRGVARTLPRRPVSGARSPGRSPGSRIVLLPTPSRPRGRRPVAPRGFRPRLQ